MKVTKIVIALFWGWCIFLGCGDENIESELSYYENLWEIKDNPNDPVQHRAFEIYQKYGVPVFLNDTIGKIFVKINIHGDSVFRYETIDLNWNFSSESYSTPYTHTYIKETDKCLVALDLAAKYLETIPAGIYPFSMLLTEKTVRPDMSGDVTSISFGIFFRTLLLSNILKQNTDAKVEKYINKIMIDVILNKIEDNAISNFSKVSDSDNYGVKWEKLEPNLPENFDPDILTDPDALEKDKKAVRNVLGKYGFVSNYEQLDFDDNWELVYFNCTPLYPDTDLQDYINEIVSITPEEFERRWGDYPLVMRKYEFIRNCIPAKK